MTRVAVLGAAGFIGNRAVEMLHRNDWEVVPVVRRAASLALSSRYSLTGAVADASDENSLVDALKGCEAVVSSVTGPPKFITDMCRPLVAAARAAGVRRIVHLSSQMVHGQSLAPGVTEETPFPRKQPLAYNQAKANAEGTMRSLASAAGVEVIILRPGIVYGPRSRWTGGTADDLLAGEAFLLEGSGGACNAIYVDNLVHAIELSLAPAAPVDQSFFVNDDEHLRWPDLILPIAEALGIERGSVPRASLGEVTNSPSRFQEMVFPIARSAFRKLPRSLAHVLRAARMAAAEHRSFPGEQGPSYSREMALLQSNEVYVTSDKAARLLGYRPSIPHGEAMRRSIAWLRFAGYPVV